MILHDAIKTITNKFFPFSLKKEQNLVYLKKNKKNGFFSTLSNPYRQRSEATTNTRTKMVCLFLLREAQT